MAEDDYTDPNDELPTNDAGGSPGWGHLRQESPQRPTKHIGETPPVGALGQGFTESEYQAGDEAHPSQWQTMDQPWACDNCGRPQGPDQAVLWRGRPAQMGPHHYREFTHKLCKHCAENTEPTWRDAIRHPVEYGNMPDPRDLAENDPDPATRLTYPGNPFHQTEQQVQARHPVAKIVDRRKNPPREPPTDTDSAGYTNPL